MSASSLNSPRPPSFREVVSQFLGWSRRNPLHLALLLASLGAVIYFFGFLPLYVNGTMSAARWARGTWEMPENNQEHAFVVLPVALLLLWVHRGELKNAPVAPLSRGILVVAAGVLLFVLGSRTLQPRLALFALPLVVYGSVLFLWGSAMARVFIFPCLFLLFMVPIGGIVQGTVSLQLLVSSSVKVLSSLIGVKIQMDGTTLRALDGSFNFEIAEGCSGIRSLMAMTMLSALYVHFTQRETWKQWVLFAGSIVFALIGNIGRVFTVILVARFIDTELAGGIYHDYSGFIFFPVAVSAMIGFDRLLNMKWGEVAAGAPKRERPPEEAGKKTGAPISYDY